MITFPSITEYIIPFGAPTAITLDPFIVPDTLPTLIGKAFLLVAIGIFVLSTRNAAILILLSIFITDALTSVPSKNSTDTSSVPFTALESVTMIYSFLVILNIAPKVTPPSSLFTSFQLLSAMTPLTFTSAYL